MSTTFVLHRTALAMSTVIMLSACELSGSQDVGFQSRVDVATRMLQSGQHASGYQILDQVATDHAGSPEAYLAIGNAYLEVGAFAKADNAFATAARYGAQEKATIGLGRAALARNAPDEAIQHFSSVLKKEPRNLTAINGIGVALDLKGQHTAARIEYNKVLAIDPTHVAALNNLALSNTLHGSGEIAVAFLQYLTRSQINDPTLRQNLALALSVTGRQQDAFRLATADISEKQAEAVFQLVANYRRTPL